MNKREFSKLVNAEKNKLTDKEIFFSPDYKEYLQNIADNITGKYGRGANVKLSFVEDETACTDGDDIFINIKNPITVSMKKASRAERNLSYIGLLGHESAHILYTDFTVLEQVSKSVVNGELFPPLPDESEFPAKYRKNRREILDTLAEKNPRNLNVILQILHRLQNTLEDGYIERLMSRKFPGTIKSGIDINNKAMEGKSISVKKMLSKGLEPLSVICNALLIYVKGFEATINPEKMKGCLIDTIEDCKTPADMCLDENDPVQRMKYANDIFVYVWEYVKPMIVSPPEENNDQAEEEQNADEKSNPNGDSDSGDGEQSGDSNGQSNGQSPNGNSGSGDGEQSGNSNGQPDGQNPNGNSGSGDGEQSGNSNGQSNGQSPNGNSGSGDGEQSGNSNGQPDGQSSNEGSSSDGKRNPDDVERKFYNEGSPFQSEMPTGRDTRPVETDGDTQSKGSDELSEQIFDKLENKLAAEKTENKIENELTKELKLQAKKEGTVNYKVNVTRQKAVSDSQKMRYELIMKKLKPISKALQKRMLSVIKERKKNFTERGLYMGTRLDQTAYARTDLKVFTKRNRPNDEVSLAVALLVDESGSMEGEKIERARQTALVVYDFCSALDIPVAIYGHTTSGFKDNVEMFAYADYDSVDGNDKYRLTEISDRGCNRDGAAIRFVIKRLEKRSEAKRLFIIISDGQPYAAGYYGDVAFKDLHNLKKEYERKGIVFFTAAIDEDKEAIKKCYGERSFLDLSDLSKLPLTITKLIAKHI